MKTRLAPSTHGILVPKMECHIVEGLGISHELSETSLQMGYVGFCLVSPQPHSPQYSTSRWDPSHTPFPCTQPNLIQPYCLTHFHPQIHPFTASLTPTPIQVNLL